MSSRPAVPLAIRLLLPAVLAPAAVALPDSPSAYLDLIDLDDDRRVGLAEYRDYMSRGFRRMDADGNGRLEGAELPVPDAAPVDLHDHLDALARAFARLDRDGDGMLDVHELAAPP